MTVAGGWLRILACVLPLSLAATSAVALEREREDVRRFIDEMQRRHGFERAWLDEIIGAAASQPRVIELISRPAERVMAWPAYRSHFITAERIAAGLEFWTAHRDRLAEVESQTGVDAAVIVGIIGVETFFGRITGRYRVLDALATLAFDYPPRSGYFRDELEQFLLLVREEQVDVRTALGSYAGAMGAPQFMPRSYRAYAVDGDGDGRRDLWSNWDDVIASVANYLARHGWRAGQPVSVPAAPWFPQLAGLKAGGLTPNETVKSLRDMGLGFATDQDPAAPALFIDVAGDAGREYRAGFHNFGVITRYNRSVLYALVVQQLGERIQGQLPPLN